MTVSFARTLAVPATLIALAAMPARAQEVRPATLTGKVQSDTTMRVLPQAEVFLPALSRTTTTDDKGEFRILDIPPGTHLVVARKIGYARYEVLVEFKPGETVEKRIVIPRLTQLDSVRVVGDANVPVSFLEHRAVGLGHFLTRDDLKKVEGRMLADALVQVPGISLLQGGGNSSWPLSKRYSVPIRSLGKSPGTCVNTPGEDIYCPDSYERQRGVQIGCYARVYLDKALLNPHTPAEPIDLKSFPPDRLEAVEWYSGASQTPIEYARLNSNCGVLVLHTRRSK